MNRLAGAVILAGGRGRRLGGRDKPALRVGDRSLLDIAIDAVGDCPIVVVGPPRDLPAGVTGTREDPPGGGPAAAVAAGVGALSGLALSGVRQRGFPLRTVIAVLAADLPGITPDTLHRLVAALPDETPAAGIPGGGTPGGGTPRVGAPTTGAGTSRAPTSRDPTSGERSPDGAVLIDAAGRRQILIGVWRADRLAAAVALRPSWSGAALRDLIGPLRVLEIPALDRESADVDTPDDWQRWQS